MPRKTQRTDGVVRDIRHPVRFAVDEYEHLKQKAEKAGVSLTEFIRRAALRRQVTELPPPPELNWQSYMELSTIRTDVEEMVKAVNKAYNSGEPINIDFERLEKIAESLSTSFKRFQVQLLECNAKDDDRDELS